MAITIDWGTQIIDVPKSATTLVQLSPVEIRQLNINDFRLQLKSLEASLEGMPHLRTHNHNTEVSLGGIVYARVVEIINGYTITFEDGTYAVNLVGANSNIGDVVNLNSVSIRSSNSAGLISNQAIEYASYNGGVTISENGVTGTAFPRGTPQLPVNNVSDAILIAELRGFSKIFVVNNFTFDTGDNLSGYRIYGEAIEFSTLTFNSASTVNAVSVFDATITGYFDGEATFSDCLLNNVSFIKGILRRCILQGELILSGTGATTLIDCNDGLVISGITPSINFGGTGSSLAIRNYAGDIALRNKSGPEYVEVNIATGGILTLENTITNGDIKITGIVEVRDDSSGLTNVDTTHAVYPDQLQLASFGGAVYVNSTTGTAGVKYPQGTHTDPVNNINDALRIAESRNLDIILFDGPLNIVDTDISGYVFEGENNLTAVLNLISGNTTNRVTVKNGILTGEINGPLFVQDCGLQALTNIGSTIFPTIFRDCIIRADNEGPTLHINSGATENIHFIGCTSGVPGFGTATLDVNNALSPLAFRKYGGGISIDNITGNQDCTFEIDEGQIVFTSGCTSGTVRLGGIYKLTDNSNTLTIEERNQSITDNITVTGVTASADTVAIASAVWDKLTTDHQDAGSFGLLLYDLLVASGTIQHAVNLNTELLKNKPNNP